MLDSPATRPGVPEPSAARPFVVEHVLPSHDTPGSFTPAARLLVTPVLRTSGLLAQLPDAEAKSLLLLLTFLSPNGRLQASLTELADGLRTSPDKARRRMRRLAETRWQGEPLAAVHATETGLELYALSPRLIDERDAPLPAAPIPVYHAADREDVIAHSRGRYAVPRAEAERLVAQQYGQSAEELGEGEEAVARRQLLALGVPRDQVAALFGEHPLEEIWDQLRWLPLRGAKSPARFIVAAIQNRYLPPSQMRAQPVPDTGPLAGPGHDEGASAVGLSRRGTSALERTALERTALERTALDGRTLEIPQDTGEEADSA